MTLRIRNLSRRYGAETALAGIDLDIAEGELLALLGPSGAGKTTLLRLIAGLERPDAGSIHIAGRDIHQLAPRDRRIGFVFQSYALFRHMTVARNIAFGLSVKPRRERLSRSQVVARVEELLDLMQLPGLGGRFPAQLSGGQRQRVALARALAIDPQVLLLDEPFGALDARVRGELREWLRGLQRQLGLTTVFVTHDQQEAFQLADHVAILNAGRIEQIGVPAEIRNRPATPFVRTFLSAGDHSGRHLASIDIDDQVLAPMEGKQHRCCAGQRPAAAAASPRHARDRVCSIGPSWTPRVVGLLTDDVLSDDLPMIAAGELWLMRFAGADGEPTLLERDVLNRANVIIYDRSLTDAVAAAMSLGGYAEPTDGDGLARSLQFVRDGWSVIRLVERPSSDDRDKRFRALVHQLRDAGAFPGWHVRRLSENDGRWLSADEGRLGDAAADLLSARGSEATADVIVITASSGAARGLRAAASNGLAG